MNNVVLTSASQISPKSGSPLNSQTIPTVDTSEVPVTIESSSSSNTNRIDTNEQTNADENVHVPIDENSQTHDVPLETAKTNGYEKTNGLKHNEYHQMDIDDGYDEYPNKMKTCCTMLNKLFLVLAIVCFALFLVSIAMLYGNITRSNNIHVKQRSSDKIEESFGTSDVLLTDSYFNLTRLHSNDVIVTLSRRGASVHDILIPYMDPNNITQYRSILLKGNHFGSIRFGFDNEINSMSMINQLPMKYEFLNFHDQDWLMYGDKNKPSRVYFVNGLVKVIYEFSSAKPDELMMKTIVSPRVNQQFVVDPTNNIYFNLRGYGNLSTHYLNITASTPINIENNEEMKDNQLNQGQYVDQLLNEENYFYKFRAGIGKNFIATLKENETKIKINIFSDHEGLIIDPFGVQSSDSNTSMSDTYGIRLSPRQSPVYETMSLYGPTLVIHPSQAIHTTWWQFEY